MQSQDLEYQFSREGVVIAKATLAEASKLHAKGLIKNSDVYWHAGMDEWKSVQGIISLLRHSFHEGQERTRKAIEAVEARNLAELKAQARRQHPAFGPWKCLNCGKKFDLHEQQAGGLWPAVWSALLLFGSFVFLGVAGFFSSVLGLSLAGLGIASDHPQTGGSLAGLGILLSIVGWVAAIFGFVVLMCLALSQIVSSGIIFSRKRLTKGRCCPHCLGDQLVKDSAA